MHELVDESVGKPMRSAAKFTGNLDMRMNMMKIMNIFIQNFPEKSKCSRNENQTHHSTH
jgi:hypothetical protein